MDTTESFAPQVLEYYGAVTESGRRTPHLAKIGGRFIAEGAQSRNRRIYTNTEQWLAKANSKIAAGSTCDIRSHHAAEDDSTRIVGKVTKINTDGTYEASIANTEHGATLLTLVEGGYLRHVSLRAVNPVFEELPAESSPDQRAGWIKISDLDLQGIDFTNSPGIAVASVARESVLIESFDLNGAELMPATTTGVPMDLNLSEAIADAKAGATVEGEAVTEKDGLIETSLAESKDAAAHAADTAATIMPDAAPETTEADALKARIAELEAKLAATETTTPAVPEPIAEAAPAPAPVADTTIQTLVAETVKAVLTAERETFEAKVREIQEAHKKDVEEILTARRKTRAVTESDLDPEAEVDAMSLGDLIKLHLGNLGHDI